MNFKRFLPILKWFPNLTKQQFRGDIVAGLTVWVMLVPQGMAYAMLAGMPPIYGLYGGLVPLFLYAFFGTSRQVSVGPVAVSALLVLAGISQIAEPNSPEYIAYVILTGLLIGLLQFFASLIRMGFLVNFLSHPVIAGFTSAAAVIIAVSQLKYLLGISIPRFSELTDTLAYAIEHIDEIHFPSFLLCTSGIVIIWGLKKISKALPGALIAVILGILAVHWLQLDQQGIEIIGSVPEGLPSFQWPAFTLENIKLVLPTVLTVTIIGIVESISIAKVWERRHRNYKIRANQELFALGISKIGGAFFQALPSSASFSRSAVNSESGAKTQLSSIITATLVGLTLIFLTPLFFYLPTAILAAIILRSVVSLFDIQEAIHLWKTHKGDFAMLLLTFVITLFWGIEEGVLAGVLFSVMMVMYRSATPDVVVLGQLPNTRFYRNIERFPEAIQLPDCLIVRFDSQLFFANVSYFRDRIENLVLHHPDSLKAFVLDASSIHDIDSTGLHTLEEVCDFLKERDIQFYVSGIIGPVRDSLHQAGLMDKIGKANQFMYIHETVESHYKRQDNQADNWKAEAVQTNYGNFE